MTGGCSVARPDRCALQTSSPSWVREERGKDWREERIGGSGGGEGGEEGRGGEGRRGGGGEGRRRGGSEGAAEGAEEEGREERIRGRRGSEGDGICMRNFQ